MDIIRLIQMPYLKNLSIIFKVHTELIFMNPLCFSALKWCLDIVATQYVNPFKIKNYKHL